MQPCSTCGEWTEFREISSVFYCDWACQKIGHDRLVLSGNGGDGIGGEGKELDWDHPPEFFDSELLDAIRICLNEYRIGLPSRIHSYWRKVNELGNRLIRNLKISFQYTSILIRLNVTRTELERLKKEIEESETERSKLYFPIEGTLEEEEEYLVAMEIYNDYIKEKQENMNKLIISGKRFLVEKQELSKLKFSNEGIIGIEKGLPLQKLLDTLSERIEISLNFMAAFKKKMYSFWKDGVEEVEGIVIERIEVKTGMTERQEIFFSSLVQTIKEAERNEKGNDLVAKYLRKSDVIMHIPLRDFLTKAVEARDGFLRNIFEIGRGRGSNDIEERKYWEHKIFLSQDYDNFEPHDKVKYGTVNWARSREGVRQLKGQYGKSYLILSENVKRDRCTYCRYDSSVPSVTGPSKLGNYQTRMVSISKEFTGDEIYSMENKARYFSKSSYNEVMETAAHYMEVQIHGEVVFARDISKIMIDPYYKGDKEFLNLLQEYFKIIGTEVPYEFI